MPSKHTDNHWRGGILLLLPSVLFEGWEMALNIMALVKAASLEPSSGSLTITVPFLCVFSRAEFILRETLQINYTRQGSQRKKKTKKAAVNNSIVYDLSVFPLVKKNWLVNCQGVCKKYLHLLVFLSGEGIWYFSSSLKNNNSTLCQTESIFGQPQCDTLWHVTMSFPSDPWRVHVHPATSGFFTAYQV